MRRHDSLMPLTHDHHHALVQVRRLRAAAEEDEKLRLNQAREFVEFFNRDTTPHFKEEEEVILPLLSELPEAETAVERVLKEHLHLHALLLRLVGEIEAGDVVPATMDILAATLEAHIRFEEKVVFPLVQTLVSEADLDSITLAQRDRLRAPD